MAEALAVEADGLRDHDFEATARLTLLLVDVLDAFDDLAHGS